MPDKDIQFDEAITNAIATPTQFQREFTNEQANLNFTLAVAQAIYQNSKDNQKPLMERDLFSFINDLSMQKIADKIFAKNSATTIYKSIKSLTDVQYSEAAAPFKRGMSSALETLNERIDETEKVELKDVLKTIKLSVPDTKQGMLNQISNSALKAGIKINPTKGEDVAVNKIEAKVIGALSFLQQKAKELINNFGSFQLKG